MSKPKTYTLTIHYSSGSTRRYTISDETYKALKPNIPRIDSSPETTLRFPCTTGAFVWAAVCKIDQLEIYPNE